MALDRAKALAALEAEGINSLIDKYITTRDAVEMANSQHKNRIKDGTELMDLIEAVLQKKMQEAGVDTAGSQRGTVFYSPVTRCGVADWDQLLPVALANPQLLNKAVNKTAVVEWMENNDGVPPPGVRWDEERQLAVRKK
jgi:hypothetical protein